MSTSFYKWIFFIVILALLVISYMYFINYTSDKSKAREQMEQTLKDLRALKAYDQYQQGRTYWNKRNEPSLRKGIEYFNNAIRLDSNFAPAYAGIADCYAALGYGSYEPPVNAFLKAESAALHALELDSTLADAHTSLGYIRFYFYWDWQGAEQEFRKAQQLEPQNELSFSSYTYFLTAMGRFSEARSANEKAFQLNPLSSSINTDKGFLLYYSGHYHEAVKSLTATIIANPKNPLTHLWLGRAYQEQNKFKEAISEYKITLDLNKDWPVAWAAIGNAYGNSGQYEMAKQAADTLLSLSHKRFVTPYGLALVYASINEKSKAFEWLDKAYMEHSNWMVWLSLDPRWKMIRSDKRFVEILTKMKLIQSGSHESSVR